MKINRFVFGTLAAAVFLLLSSCEPITRSLVAAVEDDFSPTIIVESPTAGSVYYSTIEVTGHINDDSLSTGDNLGLLASLSFEIASDPDHRGRITIDASGDTTKDTGYGNVDILYNPVDRSFSFTVLTSNLGYPPQILYLRINTVDFNGNETSESVQLVRSEGPYVELVQPGEPNYLKGGSFTVSGSVANSIQHYNEATAAGDPVSASELATLTLEILALGINVSLDIAGGETSVDLFPRSDSLLYDPSSRSFLCPINLSTSDDNVASLTIRVTATDLNGNSLTETRSMTQIQEAGPAFLFYEPSTSGTFYYSGDNSLSHALLLVDNEGTTAYSSLKFRGWVYSLTDDGRLIDTATLELTSGGYSDSHNIKTEYVSYYPDLNGRDYYQYEIDFAGSVFQEFDGLGTAEVTLTAVDDTPDARVSTKSWLIYEDSEGPSLTSPSITTGNGSRFVSASDTVELSFSASDGSFQTGFNPNSLSGSVGGVSLTASDFTPVSGSTYSVSVDLSTATQDTDERLEIEINASDHIGNSSTITETDFVYSTSPTRYVRFVSDAPPNITHVNIAADDAPTDFAAPGQDVTVTVTADQEMDPDALSITIAGVPVLGANESVAGTSLSATATIPGGYTTDPVAFTLNTVENLAGIAADVSSWNNVDEDSDSDSVNLIVGPPSLTDVSVEADTAPVTAVKPGDSVTMTIVADQLLDPDALVISIAGVTATVNEAVAGTTLTATAAIPGAYSVSPIPYSISVFENIVGVAGSVPSDLKTQFTIPDIELYSGNPNLTLSIESNNADVLYAQTGNTISLDISSDIPLFTEPTVSIGGSTDDVSVTGADSSWTATLDTSLRSPAEGLIAVSVSAESVIHTSVTGETTIDTGSVTYYPGDPGLSGSVDALGSSMTSPVAAADTVVLAFTMNRVPQSGTDPVVKVSDSDGPELTLTKDSGTSSGSYFEYTYTVDTDYLAFTGTISYSIVLTDAAGNTSLTPLTGDLSAAFTPTP